MRFNFPFAWYNKFGTIPETYKEAMSYEEQILWLCEHQKDLEDDFESFGVRLDSLEDSVQTLSGRVDTNALNISNILSSIVSTITSSSTTSEIASAKSVYDFVTSYAPPSLISVLDSDILLTSYLVALETGLYYSGTHTISTNTGTILPENVLMIPQNTLFYYDGTQNSFVLFYNESTPNRERWIHESWRWFEDTSGVEPDTSCWQIHQNLLTNSLDSFSTATEIPSALCVYQALQNASGITELSGTDVNIWELDNGIYSTPSGMTLHVMSIAGATIPYQTTSNEGDILIVSNHSTDSSNYLYLTSSRVYNGHSAPSSSAGRYNIEWNNIQYKNLLTTSLSASSDDYHYPSAKCVYDIIGNVESVLQTLNSGNGVE